MQNNNMTDDVVEIDLQELLGLLIHWLWLIIACGIVTGVLGFAISYFVITPQYESTTMVCILNKQNENSLTYSDMQMGTQLSKDYAQLIKSRTVLEKVIESCGLTEGYDSFADRVDVENITDTRMITITVTDENPQRAQLLADEVRKEASEHITSVMDIQAVNVADEANFPTKPSSPNVLRWTAVGFLLGAFLCAMVLIIRFLLDDSIKTSDDVEKYLELSTLAMIPLAEQPEKRHHRKKEGNTVSRTEKENRAAQAATDLVVEELEPAYPQDNVTETDEDRAEEQKTEG